ncbi:MAG: hypothetical protein AAF581_04875 [Planctomycetota bacterium]
MIHFLRPCVLATLLVVCTPIAAAEIEVRTFWNFDNRLVPQAFNRLLVTVHNPSTIEFHDHLVLVSGLQQWVHEVYVSPGATQHVAFYVYSEHESWGNWMLSAARTTGQQWNADGRTGTPEDSVSLIAGAGSPLPGGGYPSALFPDDITGVPTSLTTVFIDHSPSWSRTQARAFVDWIHRGGTVIVQPDQWGEMPVFSNALELLNAPPPLFLGGGRVLRAQPAALPTQLRAPQHAFPVAALTPRRWTGEHQAKLRPDHPWPLITLVCFVYSVCLIIGNFILARRCRGLTLTIIGLLVTVGLATLAIYGLGRMSYDAQSALHEFVYKRPVSEGRCEITRVATLFSATGGRYEPYASQQPQLQSELSNWRRIDSAIATTSGTEITLPLFSSRDFVHRSTDQMPSLLLRVGGLPTPDQLDAVGDNLQSSFAALDEIRVELDGERPQGLVAWLQLGQFVHGLKWKDGVGRAALGSTFHPARDVIMARAGGESHWSSAPNITLTSEPGPKCANTSIELFFSFENSTERAMSGRKVQVFSTHLHHHTLMQR